MGYIEVFVFFLHTNNSDCADDVACANACQHLEIETPLNS